MRELVGNIAKEKRVMPTRALRHRNHVGITLLEETRNRVDWIVAEANLDLDVVSGLPEPAEEDE